MTGSCQRRSIPSMTTPALPGFPFLFICSTRPLPVLPSSPVTVVASFLFLSDTQALPLSSAFSKAPAFTIPYFFAVDSRHRLILAFVAAEIFLRSKSISTADVTWGAKFPELSTAAQA
ncbi:hypothetical protein PCANC_10217 [Puccinia coronata f. sp. avenae]|uniref:Uncharacterized protein n=1 Tax=Puccinia coronata f. sp. avenae TaxID=200324 RepID=A0A2N5VEK9_9BASI|nr:hypothetical protein PCANC_10217 [Puccinia coronata f. sp. avenae]